ncbi:MAG: glycosyltransferase, partial [Planctomycetes bacterium]|nr:glycosyltransferase [Planctomycetota bacterium]
ARSSIQPPGVDEFPPRGPRSPGPLRILWAARWEYDKDPATFFAAIKLLADRSVDFRLSVIGETFREVPEVFAQAEEQFAARIDRWGYQSSRADYEAALAECDVFVSTAQHEFFGITAVEAMAAGAFPLLPRRLAYPELLEASDDDPRDEYFYDGTAEALAERLSQLSLSPNTPPEDLPMQRFTWNRRVPKMDEAVERIAEESGRLGLPGSPGNGIM